MRTVCVAFRSSLSFKLQVEMDDDMLCMDRDVQKEDGVGNRTKCINNLLVICVERMLTCNVENVKN